MKDFFKTMFACLLAFLVAGVVMVFFGTVMIGILAAAGGEKKPVIHDDSVLVVDLSMNLADAPPTSDGRELLELFGSSGPPRLQLRKVIDAIDAAADDDRIQAIFLKGSFSPVDYGSGFAALLEMRNALQRFRDTGKPVIAYLIGPSTRDYMVASVASRIVINPMGLVVTPGLSAEVMYFGGTFEKFGIGVQIAKAGKYKSYGENYTKRNMSDAEREQLTALLDDVWSEFKSLVSTSRKIDPDALQTLIDTKGVFHAQEALEDGLVDEVKDFSAVLDDLKKMTGKDEDAKTFTQVSLPAYIESNHSGMEAAGRRDRIAVVYADGEIVDGEGGSNNVGGEKLARELRKLRRDDNVKAVVLRVNSPGGSAVASEVIRSELVRLHAEKPVVVSMGSVAASGGYWISTESDHIYAEPNTITGSIGVVAVLPNIEGLAQKLELNVENIKTGENADAFSIAKPRSPQAMALLQKLVDDTYVKFIDRVSNGRNMDREAVEAIAGGRVWSGADALDNGLVDEIGGLETAIAKAAELAGVTDYSVEDRPPPRSFIEELMEKLQNPTSPLAGRGPASEVRALVSDGYRQLERFNDPHGVYAVMPMTLRIN